MMKVRILHVASEMGFGGLENVIMNYMRHIDREKFSFDFLLSKTARGEYEEEIEALGGKIYKVARNNPVKYILGLNKFFKKHAKEYDIVHLHHVPWGFMAQIFAALYGVKSRILHVHFDKKNSRWNLLKKIAGEVAKKYSTDYFSCSLEAGKAFYGNPDSSAIEFHVWNNAINTSRFDFNPVIRSEMRRSLEISDSCLLLGQVGRLAPEKNQEFTIDLVKEMVSRGEDVKCLFVGDGPCRKELMDYAKEKEVLAHCIFVGAVANPEDYLQAMDMFIFPSWKEGLGLVAVEAQATGLKCLVSSFVPAECEVSDLVTFIPLTDGVSRWADFIIKEKEYGRKGQTKLVKKAGYAIEDIVSQLQIYYEKKKS